MIFCPQVLQMYLPFCGIAISNAQLFAASRKEYDRSRVRTKVPASIITPPPPPGPQDQHYYNPHDADSEAEYWSGAAHLLPLQWGGNHRPEPCMDIFSGCVGGWAATEPPVHDLNLIGNVKGCTNLCHTLISNGREHNETTARRREEW